MFRKRNWLVTIESPLDGTGKRYYTVVENSSRKVFVKNAEHFAHMVDKYKPNLLASDTITYDKLKGWEFDIKLVENDYSIK